MMIDPKSLITDDHFDTFEEFIMRDAMLFDALLAKLDNPSARPEPLVNELLESL